MKYRQKLACLFAIMLISTTVRSQDKFHPYDPAMNDVANWFNAFALIWQGTYEKKQINNIDFVLFDETYVYTNSIITGEHGEQVDGPQLLNQEIKWYRKVHNDTLTLPNHKKEIVQITAHANQNQNNQPFFVMPLTSYWGKNKVDTHGISLESFVTLVFLHEFSHTQQLNSVDNFSSEFERYSIQHPNDNVYDDMLQDYYSSDEQYKKYFSKEMDCFKKAAFATSKSVRDKKTIEALKMMNNRQLSCLKNDNRDISKLDDFFLTFEGVGQFTAFLWLIDKNGGNMTETAARKVLATIWWSQEEGLDIMILLSRFISTKLIGQYMFHDQFQTSISFVKKAVNQ